MAFDTQHPATVLRPRARFGALSCSAALVAAIAAASPSAAKREAARPATYANPIDLGYRFALQDHRFSKGLSAREAADPTIVAHKGTYWLFASKSGGYWHSRDLLHWTFVEPASFPTEDYAPTVEIVDGNWVLATSGGKALYTTSDPLKGVWRKVRDIPELFDPDLFLDDDGRLYLYSGSSFDKPIAGIELDRRSFAPKGSESALIPSLDPVHRGWEARDQLDTDEEIRSEPAPPWMEAAWMTKHAGTYYLQYAAPGTELPTYADGVYTARSPLGPYRYADYSPISYKPTGFITSAGHSSTFKGPRGTDWRVTTMLVGVSYMFERRLGLFPTGFVKGPSGPDQLVTNTYLGDYPQLAPGIAKDPLRNNLAGWMLQSLRKPAAASSTLGESYGAEKAFDEDIRTWWAAATGNPGEWLKVDMGKKVRIDAAQINFADARSTAYGRLRDAYRYVVDVSDDGRTWRPLIDRSRNERDAPHEYVQLDRPVFARYARITNVHTPAGAVFSISGLRFFGSGLGAPPRAVPRPTAVRHPSRRVAQLSWPKVAGADFYVVRYGTRPDLLTLNYQVYGATSVTLPGLNSAPAYFFTVDAVNDSGIARGTATTKAP